MLLYLAFAIPPLILGLAAQAWVKNSFAKWSEVPAGRLAGADVARRILEANGLGSIPVAAHEVGHAIQHARGNAFFKLRTALAGPVQFASQAWIFLLFGGLIFGALGLVKLGIALYAIV